MVRHVVNWEFEREQRWLAGCTGGSSVVAEWFALFLLGVQSIVVTSTPAWIQLHVQLLLLASHLIVARLLCLVQCVPLTHTQ